MSIKLRPLQKNLRRLQNIFANFYYFKKINISNANDLIITNKKEENKSFITLNEINMEMTQGKNENNRSSKKIIFMKFLKIYGLK